MQSFASGDVFVGATLLNNPDDDHAGIGRIIQYDAELNEKGVLWVEGTTHLVYGLSFAPDGVLWASDPWSWVSIRVSPDGEQLPNRQFAQRAFSTVHFTADGDLWFTESLGGDNQPLPLTTRHPVLPGHETRLGDGGLYRYSPDGELLQSYFPEYHGGMSGSMAITHSVMSADQRVLIYVSETGPRLMRFDLEAGRQLPDLQNFEGQPGQMFFDLARAPGGRLLITRGDRVEILDEAGRELGLVPLEGFGWSVISDSPDGRLTYVANWFSGEVVRLDLETGAVTARTTIAPKCIAGVARFPGS
ncbi:MAG: hypothetical protein QNJ73_01895 [Gammaproteobacteria bacterium]|nr:hypothetical protein [Gammaproteobacteria bacterium]